MNLYNGTYILEPGTYTIGGKEVEILKPFTFSITDMYSGGGKPVELHINNDPSRIMYRDEYYKIFRQLKKIK